MIPDVQLLVVDIQEKFIPHILEIDTVIGQTIRMVRAARVLEIPITVTEQNPAGLGRTEPRVLAAIEEAGAPILEKMTFSACGVEAVRHRLEANGAEKVAVTGIETHVCILQTTEDLLQGGFQPYVLADAVSSRRRADRDVAIERMRSAGAIVTTVESFIFEILGTADHAKFRAILPVVK